MRNTLLISLLAAATMAPLSASADDFYAGATIAGRGNLTFSNPANGKSTDSDTKAMLKLYAGFALSDYLALEGGYMQSGVTRFDKDALGLQQAPTFKLRNLYLAGRATHHFNQDWSVFGKAGVVRSRFTTYNGAGSTEHLSSTRPLLGAGVAYNVSKAVALTLELEHIGTTRKPGFEIKQNALQLGVKAAF